MRVAVEQSGGAPARSHQKWCSLPVFCSRVLGIGSSLKHVFCSRVAAPPTRFVWRHEASALANGCDAACFEASARATRTAPPRPPPRPAPPHGGARARVPRGARAWFRVFHLRSCSSLACARRHAHARLWAAAGAAPARAPPSPGRGRLTAWAADAGHVLGQPDGLLQDAVLQRSRARCLIIHTGGLVCFLNFEIQSTIV